MAYEHTTTPPAYDINDPGGETASPQPFPWHLNDRQDKAHLADDSIPSPTPHKHLRQLSNAPHQPNVLYVAQDANTGHVVLSPTASNGQLNAVEDTKETFILQIVLSCFVFWLCGFLFGFIAFILALLARRKLSNEPHAVKTARDLGKASYVTSIIGIVVAAFIIFIILIIISILIAFSRTRYFSRRAQDIA